MVAGGWSHCIALRAQFERWFVNRTVGLVVMEACGSAHHWARWLNGPGIEVRLLPAAYLRAYVKRNKTDAADACALLEAARCAEIVPVRVKSIEQQALQGLHRTRSLWMGTHLAHQCVARLLPGVRHRYCPRQPSRCGADWPCAR
jgi:transposase